MAEAARRVIEFAFLELKLNRIEVKAAKENIASNATIRKLGFVFEGTARSATRSRATKILYDANNYGLLKEDFEKSLIKS